MDNTPRHNVGKAAWIDYSAQQALAALCITKIAEVQNKKQIAETYINKYNNIKSNINKLLWDDKTNFYYDMTENEPHMPDFVVIPENKEQLVELVKFCNEFIIPITPYISGNNVGI